MCGGQARQTALRLFKVKQFPIHVWEAQLEVRPKRFAFVVCVADGLENAFVFRMVTSLGHPGAIVLQFSSRCLL